MLFDLNDGKHHNDSDLFDVCIAGGGMAGISIAVALANKGRRILIVESGGREYDEQSQDLYRGDILGRGYFELDTARLRFLGGSSNHWAGMCRPLDDIDFRAQQHIPHSGWQIDYRDLQPYHRQVCDILEISDDFTDIELPSPSEEIKRIRFRFSEPPVRFGEKYLKQLEEDANITFYLNANLVDIRIDEATGKVTQFHVANYRNRSERHGFRARYFVLALGGIENPRMMLASRSQIAAGIGNQNNLVGRYFSEHFQLLAGYYVAEEETWPFEDDVVYLAPTEVFQKDMRIANAGIRLELGNFGLSHEAKEHIREVLCYSDIIADYVRVFREFNCNGRPVGVGSIHVASEQVPNAHSRITLTNQTDTFGLPTVALDWRVVDIDRKTVVESVNAVARYLARQKYGNIKLADWILNDNVEIPDVDELSGYYHTSGVGAGYHHMGTTRMSSSPETGVVDKDLRVFGHDNLFIAGSSVFATSGHANPSFTLLQLALRLSDHLDRLSGA